MFSVIALIAVGMAVSVHTVYLALMLPVMWWYSRAPRNHWNAKVLSLLVCSLLLVGAAVSIENNLTYSVFTFKHRLLPSHFGFPLSIGAALLLLECSSTESKTARRIGLVATALALCLMVVCKLVGLASRSSLPVPKRPDIRAIALAIDNYVLDNQHLPPSGTTSATSSAQQSWRVLLLPYIGHEALYKRYRPDEPWNGPNNIKLAPLMPDWYRASDATGGFTTRYKLLTGPGTAFATPETETRTSEFNDGFQTYILVEDPSEPIDWMKPEDTTISDFLANARSANPRDYVSSDSLFVTRYRGIKMASFHGSHTEITPMGFDMVDKGLFTIAGGEDVQEPSIGTGVRVKWRKCALLLLYCVLIVLTMRQMCLSCSEQNR